MGTLFAAHATCSETCCTSLDVFNTRTVNWTKLAERFVRCFLLTMESDNTLAISVEMEEKKTSLVSKLQHTNDFSVIFAHSLVFKSVTMNV